MLEIKNLTCGYDSKFYLRDISFNVEDKELVGIIGPNGSGKTTLLRAITRVLKAKAGEVLLEGENTWNIALKAMAKKVAVVMQNPEIAAMSVEEFVLLGRVPYYDRFQLTETKRDFEIAERCMLLTETLRLKDQPLTQISGGERQLANIARALAQEPRLLLLDEPTAYLDIAHQVGILDLIKKLNRDFGLTVIMVLHDLNLASEYCRRLILLNGGRIEKIGYPEEVMDYRIIEDVYKTVVVIKENPITKKPYLFVVPDRQRKSP